MKKLAFHAMVKNKNTSLIPHVAKIFYILGNVVETDKGRDVAQRRET